MTTRRGFVGLCGASTAGIVLGLPAASDRRAASILSSAEIKNLSEQTRQVLLTLTQSELKELRKRFGIG